MNLKHLTDDELHSHTLKSASLEREAMTYLLHHLCEVQARRLFAKYRCDSLFEYCTKALKFSEPQAGRRVNAARVLMDCPEIETKINEGSLTLTSVSKAHTFFKKEAKAGNRLDRKMKAKIVKELESKATREVERILLTHSTRPVEKIRESVRIVSLDITEMKLAVDNETKDHLDRLKEIWSHEMPDASYGDIIKKMAKTCREKADPLIKAEKLKAKDEQAFEKSIRNPMEKPVALQTEIPAKEISSNFTTAPEFAKPNIKALRYIPAKVKRAVWRRDQGMCTFVDETSGQAGCSKHRVQLDHIIPFAKGGPNTVENLRLRCFTHNQWHAIQCYGYEVLKYAKF